jgi:predicted RNase H-like HicB family nuclease
METERKMEPVEILKKPYARVVVPEADGSYTAEILEFPGCVASGDSAAEALTGVEEVAADWIAASLEQGQEIPEPLDHSKYSGKLVVRMPKGLHKRAARAAVRDGVSLNQFIVTCIAEQVGERARPLFAHVPHLQAVATMTLQLVAHHGSGTVRSNYASPQVASSMDNAFVGLPIPDRREKTYA